MRRFWYPQNSGHSRWRHREIRVIWGLICIQSFRFSKENFYVIMNLLFIITIYLLVSMYIFDILFFVNWLENVEYAKNIVLGRGTNFVLLVLIFMTSALLLLWCVQLNFGKVYIFKHLSDSSISFKILFEIFVQIQKILSFFFIFLIRL